MSKAQKNIDSFHRREALADSVKVKEVKLDKKLKAPQDLAFDIVKALQEK